jgi:hypothetical protein
MSTKVVPVQYDSSLVPNITTTIMIVNGNWSVSSTTLINLYKELAVVLPGFQAPKRVVVKEDCVYLYSQQYILQNAL